MRRVAGLVVLARDGAVGLVDLLELEGLIDVEVASPTEGADDGMRRLLFESETNLDEIFEMLRDSEDVQYVEPNLKVSAIGTPGCLDGPKLKDGSLWKTWESKHLVDGKCKDSTKKYIKAVKEGLSEQFDKWQKQASASR